MKLIICVFILFISHCLGKQLSNQYVNLQVFSDSQCQNSSDYGVGYSITTDYCVSIDDYRSYVFTADKNKVSWNMYVNNFKDQCSIQVGLQETFEINSCIPSSEIFFDGTVVANKQRFYLKLTTSSTPYIPISSGSIVKTFMGNYTCDSDNILIVQYFISGTTFAKLSQGYLTYYCDINKKPYSVNCQRNGQCSQPESLSSNCNLISQFYNATSDSSPQSDSDSSTPYTTTYSSTSNSFPTGQSCESGSCNPSGVITSASCESGSCNPTGVYTSASCESGSCNPTGVITSASCESGSCNPTGVYTSASCESGSCNPTGVYTGASCESGSCSVTANPSSGTSSSTSRYTNDFESKGGRKDTNSPIIIHENTKQHLQKPQQPKYVRTEFHSSTYCI
ncbi:hypothetical protein DICPUDRAFT_82844 [Dictyostelium purpureum]|uniref:EGF-like domain-containing protein n=1 Tax=Dictyostelium purpureum TaxID=5786 RepID=F0ZXT1_DICPU|nr:uncharacterized protein DICPUDRAFT_82844 [Dictyostelium purpureum]EGC31251.1 hypothetical protein DICPUDRAFT_82844 [Dictyostelium purpureum]|eukprot:XP_003292229.1 hypothetical protein DICPUDRAFT_82844 [Dictyostelium purpureum]